MALEKKPVRSSEFEQFIALPENRDRRFELIYGEIIEKMPTQLHALIAALIIGHLFNYLTKHPIGWPLVEARYQLPDDDENSVVPDVSFTRDRSREIIDQGPIPYMPDLAVEIQSPDDTLKGLREKAAYYIANGTRLVWLVYPHKKLVEVYRPDDQIDILTEQDTLEGFDVLPGFTLPVRDIFPK